MATRTGDALVDLCTACWLGEQWQVQNILAQALELNVNQTSGVANEVTQSAMESAARSAYYSATSQRQSWPSNWKASTKARHRRHYNQACESTRDHALRRAREEWALMGEMWSAGMPYSISPLGWAIAGSRRQSHYQEHVVRLLLDRGADAHVDWGNGWTAFYLAQRLPSQLLPLLPLPEEQIVKDLTSISRTADNERLARLIERYGQEAVKQVASNTTWEHAQHPLVLAALHGDERFMHRLLDAGVTIQGVDQSAVEALRVSPLAKELLRGLDPTPPSLVYPNDKLQLTYDTEVGTEWAPRFEGGNLLAVEKLEVTEGLLPPGVHLDGATGRICGSPSVVVCGIIAITIAATNKLRRGPEYHLLVSVTSDLAELLTPDYDDFAPAILKDFPSIDKLKEWYQQMSDAEADAALDAYLEHDVGMNVARIRYPLKSLLRAKMSPQATALGYAISQEDVQIEEVIGVGGQAVVHKGRWNGITVAAKMFRFGSVNNDVKNAQREVDREVRALSSLRHIHIVHLFGYFMEPARTVMILDYCPDGELGNYCKGKPMPLKLGLVGQVLSSLVYLHSQEPPIIHGDMKPGNVLVSNGIAKLSDFGMCAGAIGMASSSVAQSAITGTAAYTAPEVFSEGRRALGPAADMYGMAVLLWEIIEERPPWQGEREFFIMRQVSDGKRPALGVKLWSPELSDTVQNWWADDAAARPSAGEAFKQMIRIESAVRAGVKMQDVSDADTEAVATERSQWEVEAMAYERAKHAALADLSRNRRQLLLNLQEQQRQMQEIARQQLVDAQNHFRDTQTAAKAELARAAQAAQDEELDLQRQIEQRKQELVQATQELAVKMSMLEGKRVRNFAELESKRDELARQTFQCCICFDDTPALDGVRCQNPDVEQRHFVCKSCFSEHVRHASNHHLAVIEERKGKIICPFPQCSSPHFADAVIFLFADDAALAEYQRCCDRLKEKQVIDQVEPVIRQELAAEFERQQAMDADGKAVHQARKHVIERILNASCPACHAVFVDFNGCCALTCHSCRRGFCAYCLMDCGNDAHAHVAHCTFGVGTFASREQYQRCRRQFVTQKLVEYIREHVEPRLRVDLLAACRQEFADLQLPNIAELLARR